MEHAADLAMINDQTLIPECVEINHPALLWTGADTMGTVLNLQRQSDRRMSFCGRNNQALGARLQVAQQPTDSFNLDVQNFQMVRPILSSQNGFLCTD